MHVVLSSYLDLKPMLGRIFHFRGQNSFQESQKCPYLFSSFIPRTLVLKTLQGVASHLGLAPGVGVGGNGEMCLMSSSSYRS